MTTSIMMLAQGAGAAAEPSAKAPDAVIVLPGATSAEGIARGYGNTFYAGDLFAGDIFRGDVKTRTAELFIDVPAGRQATGMAFDRRHDRLLVAGGSTGQAYVYDIKDKTTAAIFQFGDPETSLINDVALTRRGAWFTDSRQAQLYFVPIDAYGQPGEFTALPLNGPAADTGSPFNLNGIVAAADGKTLIVAHSGNGRLYTVDPRTGSSALIEGVSVQHVDGIVLDGHHLWAVQNFSNQVSQIKLTRDLASGEVRKVISSPLFQVPTTAALFGDILAVVNGKFDTGHPPTADQYEVVLVQ